MGGSSASTPVVAKDLFDDGRERVQEREERSLNREGSSDYRRVRVVQAQLGGQRLRLVTRPGFPEWGSVGQPAQLIADHAEIHPSERVLVCPCGHGALGVWAASRTEPQRVVMLDTNVVAVDVAGRTLSANQCEGVHLEANLPSASKGPFDAVLMQLPKGRDFARLLFLHSFCALREGGSLYLAGPTRGGIKSAIKDCAALFGPATVLGYKGGCRVARFSRGPARREGLPEIYRAPGLAHGTYREFEVEVGGRALVLRTRPGVFSWRGLDSGTRTLLEVLEVNATDTVLDMGCGYGLIGLLAAQRAARGRVTLVDVDLVACECARANLALHGIENAEVLLGDGLAAVAGRRFSLIVSNPPFHSGQATSHQVAEGFIREAHAALTTSGRLVLVANRFLRYQELMKETFGSVAALAETPQYHVLVSQRERRERRKRRRAD